MARKARQRISYVLPLANSPGGHRLGVNGLAVDAERSILYSGGRDGLICAWDLNIPLPRKGNLVDENPFASPEDDASAPSDQKPRSTTFRRQIQAHTHWVNDIVLAQDNSALVSASSDITVKLWRPDSAEGLPPQTIGLHSDYVKCLATPSPQSDWVASGGLDRKISLWDLRGGGSRLHIDLGDEESGAKGSIYALSARGSLLASGGPESIVRLWDPRTGRRITKFVGHTDNIRDILINEGGDTIITASSDQTVKVWSVTAGRCMHTLTMHNDNVWSLYSDHPDLSVFYSGDRSGLVAKTDVRGVPDMDEGLCVAVCQEHEGVSKVVSAGDYVWTATSSSSINRWKDVDTQADIQMESQHLRPRHHRGSNSASRSSRPSLSPTHINHVANGTSSKAQIPLSCVFRLSNTATFPRTAHRDHETTTIHSAVSLRKPSDVILDQAMEATVPFHSLPEETIEGQHGLIKHVMLNDRRRVLTLDTAGEVMMWDLLQCIPIQSFGKRHLEDVAPEVNSAETVANWCAVDTRTGRLACVLEENYCFDAEMYADELRLEEAIDFREDQRINLGKWVLRYLFANLIGEEIKRDEDYRKLLNEQRETQERLRRSNAPTSIELPSTDMNAWQTGADQPVTTPRAVNGAYSATTPGLSIGVATPAVPRSTQHTLPQTPLSPTAEEGNDLSQQPQATPQQSVGLKSSFERSVDYFSAARAQQEPTPSEGSSSDERNPKSPTEGEKDIQGKEGNTLFGKKFRMNFGSKILGRNTTSDSLKTPMTEEKVEEQETAKPPEAQEKVFDDNFRGSIQKIRHGYEEQLETNPSQPLTTAISPSLPNETPVLKPPPSTSVIIQEDRPGSGGVADLYRGTVASVGQDADIIENVAPMWLGDLLLRNQIPYKETVKVSFVLLPYENLLPSVASSDGNARLNANRMLRVRKILAYVAERIEAQPEQPDPNAMKPEEYLELYCQGQLVPPTMTLATLRSHVWRTGGDVMLYYKSNGKKQILGDKSAESATEGTEISAPEGS